jgi:bifunctional non-homologous end joining protein LigD
MVVEAEFHGWTHSNHIRQASFQGVREDKSPEQVRREVKTMPTSRKIAASIATRKIANSANSKVKSKEKRDDKTDREEFAGVRLTHPDRVYWDDVDVTKRALAEYYSEVWEFMRPHVTGRVIALLRCPQGAGDGRECFFQKHASGGLEAKHLVSVPDDGDKVIAVDDLSGIIALVQAGVLEIHVRGSTIDRLGDANRLVFDLDPGPGVPWKDMIAAAREVRDRLAEFKLESFIKVTGGKGLHVVLPIRPAAWEEVKTFCHGIAAEMSADSPTRFVDVSTKSKRDNRIFVDYLRNSREATAIAPYSTRARAGATVAVPIDWHELTPTLSPNQFNVMNTPQRIARLRKDPWATMGKIKQSLPKLRR